MKKLIALLLLLVVVNPIQPCTVIVGSDNEKVLVGANEDYFYENPFVWFTKTKRKKFGCAFFGYSYVEDFGFVRLRIPGRFAPQQGLNEEGLFFDNLNTPEHKLDKSDKRKAPYEAIKKMMKTCATVDEAKEFLSARYLKYFETAKILLADKNGDYIIYDGREFIKNGDKEYCVLTNFLENDKDLGNYPCPRYTIADKLFQENNEISVPNFSNILGSVIQNDDNLEGGTMYSVICDLNSGNMNLYQFQDFTNTSILNINEELEKGTRKVMLKDLFPERIYPELAEILSRKGVREAMIRSNMIQNDPGISISESELILFSKALYNNESYFEADKIIKDCLKNFPGSDQAILLNVKTSLMTGNFEDYIEYYKINGEIDHEFADLLARQDVIEAVDLYEKTGSNSDSLLFSESILNTIAYGYLAYGQIDNAIALLELNVMAYPNSSNVYDSLGEAYMIRGNIDLAIEYYKKSLIIDPANTNAVTMIDELEKGDSK